MNRPSKRSTPERLRIFGASSILLAALFFPTALRSQVLAWKETTAVRSISGQFIITLTDAAPPQSSAPIAWRTNQNLIWLEPALLAVSAERFRAGLWQQLGVRPNSAWSGKIYFTLHPARSLSDEVPITCSATPRGWNYRLDLPNPIARPQLARALSAVLLLELANRHNNGQTGRSAELPPWLIDGLAQLALGEEPTAVLISVPTKKNDAGIVESRLEKKTRGRNLLADSREVLSELGPPSFDTLSWPKNKQMAGADGGAYLAGAELFTSELLAMPDGRQKINSMLSRLPGCQNWQTAFYSAFSDRFRRPLDVEKWWSVRLVRFAAREPGPLWTVEASRARFASLMSVPVDFRGENGELPGHAEISLQNTIKSFPPEERDTVLRLKVRDLGLSQLRLSPPFASLANAYRTTLAAFLSREPESNPADKTSNGKSPRAGRSKVGITETIKKLDALDELRRQAEARLDSTAPPRAVRP
jgi:hypothetical protein